MFVELLKNLALKKNWSLRQSISNKKYEHYNVSKQETWGALYWPYCGFRTYFLAERTVKTFHNYVLFLENASSL